VFPVSIFRSGSINAKEERYSAFRFYYKKAGSADAWTAISRIFVIRSSTGEPIYNYLRVVLPSEGYWEFQMRPVSGWRLRSSLPAISVLDYKYNATSYTEGGVTFHFNGENTTITRDKVKLGLFNNSDIGLTRDGISYVDDYAKLAETFVYDEVTSTVENGPEHEVVYVNVFKEQAAAPYTDLAIVGLNIQAGQELQQLNQLSAYVLRGLTGIHDFPNVLYDMLTNPVYQARGTLSPQQVDTDSFAEATTWTRQRRYFCDLALAEPINRREWGAEVANNFLLDMVTRNGRIVLEPSFQFYTPEPITAQFNAGNIVDGSFELTLNDLNERTPVRVSVRWREERQTTTLDERGLFPVIREVTVAEVGTPDNAEVQRIDMSDYCTSQKHAIDVAKFRCRVRRLQRHAVRFRTWPRAGAIVPGRAFQVDTELSTIGRFKNGAIDADGNLSPVLPLDDGSYDVLLWRTGGKEVEETELEVADNRAVGVVNAVFALRRTIGTTMTFKAARVGLNEESEVEVEGVEFPVDVGGISLIAQGFDDDANWVIEGAI
jgi:hypothetical protein